MEMDGGGGGIETVEKNVTKTTTTVKSEWADFNTSRVQFRSVSSALKEKVYALFLTFKVFFKCYCVYIYFLYLRLFVIYYFFLRFNYCLLHK